LKSNGKRLGDSKVRSKNMHNSPTYDGTPVGATNGVGSAGRGILALLRSTADGPKLGNASAAWVAKSSPAAEVKKEAAIMTLI
jgi:hypothetical protein